ncbi:hypothetical protein GCM10023078_32310 [Gibbsiella greigii]
MGSAEERNRLEFKNVPSIHTETSKKAFNPRTGEYEIYEYKKIIKL